MRASKYNCESCSFHLFQITDSPVLPRKRNYITSALFQTAQRTVHGLRTSMQHTYTIYARLVLTWHEPPPPADWGAARWKDTVSNPVDFRRASRQVKKNTTKIPRLICPRRREHDRTTELQLCLLWAPTRQPFSWQSADPTHRTTCSFYSPFHERRTLFCGFAEKLAWSFHGKTR